MGDAPRVLESDVPSVLQGSVDGTPFLVRRSRLSSAEADPIELRFWEWWRVELGSRPCGSRFRASITDTRLSVLEQAKVILRGSGVPGIL
jgi:hypothetical protein